MFVFLMIIEASGILFETQLLILLMLFVVISILPVFDSLDITYIVGILLSIISKFLAIPICPSNSPSFTYRFIISISYYKIVVSVSCIKVDHQDLTLYNFVLQLFGFRKEPVFGKCI